MLAHNRNRACGFLLMAALSAAFASACEPPAAPSDSSISSQSFSGSVTGLGAASHQVTMARAGTVSVVLTWPAAAVDLDLYLTSSSCTTYPRTSTLPACAIPASSSSPTGVREELTMSVTKNQALRIWVDNFSAAGSTYSIEVTVR